MPQNQMLNSSNEIKALLSSFTTDINSCGFEVFVITKENPQLKKMGFIESDDNNLRKKLRNSILRCIEDKYCSSDAEYVSADKIADEQRKLYIISTGPEYDPLAVLNTTPVEFKKKDIADATGIAFCIRKEGREIWAYQHLWTIMVPNKSGKNTLARSLFVKVVVSIFLNFFLILPSVNYGVRAS